MPAGGHIVGKRKYPNGSNGASRNGGNNQRLPVRPRPVDLPWVVLAKPMGKTKGQCCEQPFPIARAGEPDGVVPTAQFCVPNSAMSEPVVR